MFAVANLDIKLLKMAETVSISMNAKILDHAVRSVKILLGPLNAHV